MGDGVASRGKCSRTPLILLSSLSLDINILLPRMIAFVAVNWKVGVQCWLGQGQSNVKAMCVTLP